MKALIIYAHPEPKSFNGALKDLAVATLIGAGHQVQVSDLHAMRFNPVAGPDDIVGARVDPEFLRLQVEQRTAWEEGRLSPDIAAEQQKLLWCDLLILQYPMYWFSLPAILKGWVDRVMTTGFVYGVGMRNETGGLAGRRAMLSLTTGAPESRFMADGLNGDIELNLFPIQHGILRFVGFDVLPPFIAWSVGRADEARRRAYLEQYRQRLLTLDRAKAMFFHRNDEYDETGRLKPGVAARSTFQRNLAR